MWNDLPSDFFSFFSFSVCLITEINENNLYWNPNSRSGELFSESVILIVGFKVSVINTKDENLRNAWNQIQSCSYKRSSSKKITSSRLSPIKSGCFCVFGKECWLDHMKYFSKIRRTAKSQRSKPYRKIKNYIYNCIQGTHGSKRVHPHLTSSLASHSLLHLTLEIYI